MNTPALTESDPTGKTPHEAGAKLDAGKNRLGLVLGGFALALEEVGKVGTYGAEKYTENGWKDVPNGEKRYLDAKYRHEMAYHRGEITDPVTGIHHLAHAAWNSLAALHFHLASNTSPSLQEQLTTKVANLYQWLPWSHDRPIGSGWIDLRVIDGKQYRGWYNEEDGRVYQHHKECEFSQGCPQNTFEILNIELWKSSKS